MGTANCTIPPFTMIPSGGGTITYSNVGVLPPGVTFSASSLTYTFYGLTTPGTYKFTVEGDNPFAFSE